jgi:chromosomal replication initiation ATPase DnaA
MEILCDNCRTLIAASRLIPDKDRFVVVAVLMDVADEFGVSISQITGQGRAGSVCQARHEAMRRLARAGFAYKEVGQVFQRHYSTVIYAMDYPNNPALRRNKVA